MTPELRKVILARHGGSAGLSDDQLDYLFAALPDDVKEQYRKAAAVTAPEPKPKPKDNK